eukprot:COSAG06_NODE_1970_length_7941_cov_5.832568_2_plen_59_part_00
MDSDRFVVPQPQRLPAYYECGSVVAGCCCTGALLAAAGPRARGGGGAIASRIVWIVPK